NERVLLTLKARDKAERETGERKMYFPNVTAEALEAIKRMKFVKAQGGEYAMVDVITIGFSGMQTIRNAELGLVLHGHRAMHAAIDRNKKHGISMLVLAKISRLLGVDQLHIGTAGAGKMDETPADDLAYKHALEEPLYGIKPVLSVCSGGLYPATIPYLVKTLGSDIVIQLGGGIHGHPQGTRVGATAARQALEATMQHTPLKEYAKTHEPLAIALKHWHS
ncbi:MAG: RuBisCO large subunit C-terminal-like domain-containing protein, partial [Candidatus Micrarchaeota archaeon]